VEALGTQLETALRQAVVLVAADRANLLAGEDIPLPTSPRSDSAAKIVLAAETLGLTYRDSAGSLRWTERVRTETSDAERRQKLCAMLPLYATYVTLAASGDATSAAPKSQVSTDPQAYRCFLEAVHVSNLEHAVWVAELPAFSTAKTLVDVGGGYGTFALAWVNSAPERDAVVVDLPGVAELSPEHPKIRRMSADLLENCEIPPGGDVYFFANVLHLLSNWRQVLGQAALAARPSDAMLAVYEARPEGAAGRWFDLQIHLRSGRITSLLDPREIEEALGTATGNGSARFSYSASGDPLRREFQLTVSKITDSEEAVDDDRP
jgi:hypothetical protein